MDYENIFKAIGENTRIRIVKLLSHKAMYVCELEVALDISQPRISQHLKILKHAGLVNDIKDGKRTIYSLNTKFFESVFYDFVSFIKTPLEQLDDYNEELVRLQFLLDHSPVSVCRKAK